jgi:hypothetical protein
MIVRVEFGCIPRDLIHDDEITIRDGYAYECAEQVEVGDVVLVPTGEATVIGFGTSYKGHLDSVREVIRAGHH